MGVVFVKRACWPGPVTSCRGAGWDCCAGFPRSCRGSCRRVVRGPAGAPAAVAPARARARTNELVAGERRPMIGGEEEPAGYGVRGLGWVAGSPSCAWSSEWSHMHPFGTCRSGGRHDRDIRGPGCSVTSSSAAGPAHAETRAHPGLGDPSRLVTAPHLEPGADVVVVGLAARSASVSRCQARASSLRAIAVVAIFLPRRRAMAW
jgi:hypothetical protein